jgi:hypothetical protein
MAGSVAGRPFLQKKTASRPQHATAMPVTGNARGQVEEGAPGDLLPNVLPKVIILGSRLAENARSMLFYW